ncbi:MAG: sugar phosphate isomerase/epimerase [Planctomycetaceae bacterium]|jgi:sugar phosphate isomerase/epimerase|nr:sugar phosphate isomerase/epimerase [Planctomycetaceae bacterium]
MKRRSFLTTAAASAFGIATLSPEVFAAARGWRIPVSVQVYSVRDAAKNDLAGTLKKIGEIGYDGVEFAGYYGKDAKEVRKYLDDAGLKCSGTHTGIGDLRGKFDQTVELHKTLGTKYIIVPWIDPKEFKTVDGIKKYADEFNSYAERAKKVGLAVGYHAHAGDAQDVEGKTAFERFFEGTTKDVIMEVDLGNYIGGGGDPYKMIEKFRGRSKAIHLKETEDKIFGEGNVDWKRVFGLCETVGGTEWYVVEDERSAGSVERIEKDYNVLKEWGKTKESVSTSSRPVNPVQQIIQRRRRG